MIRIGTSGIVLPGAKATFPEEYKSGSRLHYYASLFNTLEINSSFYKIPLASTFAKWQAEVPENFKFTVKLWKGITHSGRLDYQHDDVVTFMSAVNNLNAKSGCILIQFPASITIHCKEKIEVLLQQLRSLDKSHQWELAIEFRHNSWYQDEIYMMLEKYVVAMVFHDMPNSKTPLDYQGTGLIYCRFHGPVGDYKGSYDDKVIQEYAYRIKAWNAEGRDIYAYFNNTMEGALMNAQRLQTLV